jgi:hypothetical protein
MPKIFISYSTVDRPIVKRLVEALSERGWSVFWDSDIQPGENWHQKIATELEAADCTIVLWTKNSVRSFWVIEEAMYSRQRGVLLPVIFENVSPPPGFLSLQCVNLLAWRNDQDDAGFRRLCDAIVERAGAPLNRMSREEASARSTGEADGATSGSVATATAPSTAAYVYEGESIPWLNWSALLLSSLFLAFQDEVLNTFSSFLEGIMSKGIIQSFILVTAFIFVLFGYRPILWNAKRLNSREVTAVFVFASLALFQLLASIFAAYNVRLGTLHATETGQLVASAAVGLLAVVVWFSRDYQKSWLEVGFLWLGVCWAVLIISVYAAIAYYGDAPVGYGRLYPRGTGLLVGSALIALSTAVLLVAKFRHMSAAELAFFWVFGSTGLIVFARILSIALFGRQQEIQNLRGTLIGLVLAICIGVVLVVLRIKMGGTSRIVRTRKP